MTRDQAVQYLGLDATADDLTETNMAVIQFAADRGFYLDAWEEIPVEFTIARQEGFPGYEQYEGDLEYDLTCVAQGAVEFLRDEGLLPIGYGYDPERPDDGYGNDKIEVEE